MFKYSLGASVLFKNTAVLNTVNMQTSCLKKTGDMLKKKSHKIISETMVCE